MKLRLCFISVLLLLLTACQHKASLQKFYVNHQDDENFLVIDIPTSLLYGNISNLQDKTQKALMRIEKANVLALPLNGNNKSQYDKSVHKLLKILKQKRYKLLFKLQFSGVHFQVQYTGNESAITELIITAYSDEKGFVVARLLGKDMTAESVVEVLKAAHSGNLNINSFQDVLGGGKK